MKRLLTVVVLQVFLVAFAYGEAKFAPAAQALLEEAAKAKKAVGMTAAIWQDGAVAWEGAVGFADIENEVPARPNMVHRIASISKPISATALMQLVESGKVKLDAPIQTYVPAFPKKDQGDILVWHLLSHTSGIRHYKGSAEVNDTENYPNSLAAIEKFKNDPIGFTPGTKFHYSTYAYTVVGAAIEQASGQQLRDYMQEHVWGPAGMTSTRFEDQGAIVPHRSRGYAINPKGEAVNAVYSDNSVRYPGGGMLSTVGDLVRFTAAIQNGTLLKPETLEKMIQPVTLPDGTSTKYGFGWGVDTWEVLGRVLSHSGGQSGTSTNLLVSLDKGLAVSVIANTRGESGMNEVCVLLANIALGAPPPPGLTIEPEKTLSERMKEQQKK